MKSSLAQVVVAVVLLTACAGGQNRRMVAADLADIEVADSASADGEGAEDEPMPEAADELFDDFIFNFAANKRLQMERTVFPLEVKDDEGGEQKVERARWKMEHFFMNQDYYTLIFDSQELAEQQVKDTALSRATVEKIFLDEGRVMQYHFCRQSGRWMLSEVTNQSLPRNPNAQFLSFYQRFVNDSVFQHQSLSEQIAFVGPDPDNDFEQMEGVITPDFWEAFAPDLPRHLLYNIVYGKQNPASAQKILFLRGIANGLEVELTFRQKGGRWKLTKLFT